MQGTNRTIARFSRTFVVAIALTAAAMAFAAGAPASAPHKVMSGSYLQLGERREATSVAIGPEGAPWFGIESPYSTSLATVKTGAPPVEALEVTETSKRSGRTGPLAFDAGGSLWFLRSDRKGQALVRRAPDGTEKAFRVPGATAILDLAIGREGDVWFTRGYRRSPRIGLMTPAGKVTEFPLANDSGPNSITAGPDGDIWFTEERAGKIGRITPAGKIRLFALQPGVHPRQIVAGPDGRLWFSENGHAASRGQRAFDQIGRITTSGKVVQKRILFGGSTVALAADPRGLIWFTTEDNEISSISTVNGRIGGHSCLGLCSTTHIRSLAIAPSGTVWVAIDKHPVHCDECGGGTGLILENEGGHVGEVRSAALRPVLPNPAPIPSLQSWELPEGVHGRDVSLAPDGSAWFAAETFGGEPIFQVDRSGHLEGETLPAKIKDARSEALAWGPEGDLWFGLQIRGDSQIGRLDQAGFLTRFELPPGAEVNSMTIGPEGAVWFTRGESGEVGTITGAGAVTEFSLGEGSHLASIVTGPDGALWMSEEEPGYIARVTPTGEVRQFPLGRDVHPRQIVAAPDGALWFSENGRQVRPYKTADRIGRINTAGEVTQIPIPFGLATFAIAADPHGVIWFSTEKGEISSISMSGKTGARACLAEDCQTPVESLAVASDGSLWFAAGSHQCRACGGGTQLLTDQQGTEVGRIPAGALEPAP